jgi:hypothetical protein
VGWGLELKTTRKYELLNTLGGEVLVILTTQYTAALGRNRQEEVLSKPGLVITKEGTGAYRQKMLTNFSIL